MKKLHSFAPWIAAGLFLLCAASPLSAQERNRRPSRDKKTTVPLPAPVQEVSSSFRNQVLGSFLKYYERGVQEKLYLMTDKPYYSAGEKIWFKGFLVNAITLVPNSMSNFVYVELINSRDSLLQRVKIKADEFGFHNSLDLPAQMQEGEYYLRAYTRWMENEPEDYFFGRVIRVANPLDNAVVGMVRYALQPDGKVEATVRLADNTNVPIAAQQMTYATRFGGRPRSYNARTDDSGSVRFTFTPPPDSVGGSILISISDPTRQYRHVFDLPVFDTDFDVQFFPEGGHLLNSTSQTIGFKAIGTNGLGVDVACKLFRENGSLVGEFSSAHKGMGKFNLHAYPGEKYYVEAATSNKTKRFTLPEVSPSGCAIKVVSRGQRLLYQVTTTPDVDPSRLGLVVHSRGKVLLAEEIPARNVSRQINQETLPEGIMSFVVVEKETGRPLSERLVFVQHGGGMLTGTLTPNRSNYYRRELVDLAVKVTDSRGAPVAGTFALSVTDRRSVVRDSLADNIHSNLLLTSELKGHIEEPGYYFAGENAARREHLDLLMMTQGWTRFDLQAILGNKLEPYPILPETSQSISGHITGLFNNEVKDPQIIFFSPETGYMDKFQLNATNRFRFTDLDFADSTTFVLQAMNRLGRGVQTITLNINPELFPLTQALIPRLSLDRLAPDLPDAFLDQSKERYYYEGGMPLINLQMVTVTAQRVQRKQLIYGVEPTRSINSDRLETMRMMPMYMVLQTFPGVRVDMDSEDGEGGPVVLIRGSRDPAVLYIDNVQVPMDDIFHIDMHDVEAIHMVDGPEAAAFGLMGSGGVILVQLVDGRSYSTSRPPRPSIAKVRHLGYKKPDKFYQPKYDVASVRNSTIPDMRTTICWNPEIVTDSTGVARVSFYTADTPSTYDVVLEGVSATGEICRTTTTIQRTR